MRAGGSYARRAALTLFVVSAVGCSGGNETELRTWMEDTRKTMRPTTQPVPEPKQFSPYTYEAKALIDPFDPQKMILAAARQAQSRSSTSSIRPDLDRRREMLEGYPLDQLKMVGTLRQAGNQVALIDAAGQTFMVRRGNYMGQNFGLVTNITETDVDVKEIVQDAAGEWIERPTKLELQEAGKQQTATRPQQTATRPQQTATRPQGSKR
jgi:type IV pilus assembly protein PilP